MSSAILKLPKPPVPIATDIAVRVVAKDGGDVPLSYWDLWCALLAHNAFGGDLDQLGTRLREMRNGVWDQDAANRKLSHLRDFQQRLAIAGLCLADILNAVPPALAKAEARRAHGRIIKHNQRSYELSEPMRVLPKDRLYDDALRGMWSRFPVSPKSYYEQLRATINWKRLYREDDSWDLARKLDSATDYARMVSSQSKAPEAFALLRCILTVAIELNTVADDSFGCIGMSFQTAFKKYLAFPRAKVGIAPRVFLTDLLDLLVFEDYGLTHGATDGFFARLSKKESDFCISYLHGRIPALVALDLDYQAEKALTLVGQVAAEQKRFDLFEPLATEMQARHWQRIIRLADTAKRSRKKDLAASVFRHALTCVGDSHFGFLTKKHDQLLNGTWSPDPGK